MRLRPISQVFVREAFLRVKREGERLVRAWFIARPEIRNNSEDLVLNKRNR